MNSATKKGCAPGREKMAEGVGFEPTKLSFAGFKTGALGRYASPPWERLPEIGSG